MHQVRAIILKEAYDQFYSVKIFFDGHLDSMEYPMPTPSKGGGTFTPSLDKKDRFFIEIHRSSQS